MPNSSYAKLKKQGKCIKNCKRDAPSGHAICAPCRQDLATDVETLRRERREAGLCPRCGEVQLAEGEKSCLRCMLKVPKDGDMVDPITKSREWEKRLKGGGTGGK